MTMENFVFKKKFGQNFIYDGNLLSAIVSDAKITPQTEVLEIGPGEGTLTKKLCGVAKRVVAYEIDKQLQAPLGALQSEFSNLEVVFEDALKAPIEEIEKNFSGDYVVVANLPYYITSPLIFKFLASRASSLTVMVQKEVAQRFLAKPNSKDYGIPTVMINYQADVEYLRTVGRKMFTPPPNVDSALIRIVKDPAKPKAKDEKFFASLVKTAFGARRKTLVNNLLGLNIPKEKILSALNKCSISSDARAEQLSVLDFISLSDQLN